MGFFDNDKDIEENKEKEVPSTFDRVDWENMDEEAFERLSIQKEMGSDNPKFDADALNDLGSDIETNLDNSFDDDDYTSDSSQYEEEQEESVGSSNLDKIKGLQGKLKGFNLLNKFNKKSEKEDDKHTYSDSSSEQYYYEDEEEELDAAEEGFTYSDLESTADDSQNTVDSFEDEEYVDSEPTKSKPKGSKFKGMLGKFNTGSKKVSKKENNKVVAEPSNAEESADLDEMSEEELRGMSLDELEKLYEKSTDSSDVEDLSDLASQRSLNKRYERLKDREAQRKAVVRENRKAKSKRVLNGLFAVIIFTFIFSFVYYTYSDIINAGLEAIWNEVTNFYNTLLNQDIRDKISGFTPSDLIPEFDFSFDLFSGGTDLDILEWEWT